MNTSLPFADFRSLLAQLPAPDAVAARTAGNAFALRNGDMGGGRLGDLASWFASVAGVSRSMLRPEVAIFAGTHGVLRHGISYQPISSAALAVQSCSDGSAAICRLCQTFDLGLKVFDLALDLPTADITQAPALDERACAATMAFGMEALMSKPDALCLASFGAGGSTVAAALMAALHGGPAEDWLEGSDPDLMDQRKAVIDEVLTLHGEHCRDPLEALRRIGGREFAALAGAILAAGIERVPVVLHGHAALAAAVVLAAQEPRVLDHCVLAQGPASKRAAELAVSLGLRSVFDAGFGGDCGQPLAGAMALIALKGAANCAS